MPIELVCACGKRTMVDEKYAGRKGRCGGCGTVNVVPIPALAPLFDSIDTAYDPVPIVDPDEEDEAVEAVQLPPRGTASPTPSPPDVKLPVLDPDVDVLEVRCHCGKKNRFSVNYAGQQGECSSCKAFLQLPRYVYLPAVQRVHLIDAEMPFGSMCLFIAKWTLATIPTAVVLGLIYGVILAIVNTPR